MDTQLDAHQRCQVFIPPLLSTISCIAPLSMNMLMYCGQYSSRQDTQGPVRCIPIKVITHDVVDQPYQWPDWYTSIRHLGGDLIKERSFIGCSSQSLYETKIKGHPGPIRSTRLSVKSRRKTITGLTLILSLVSDQHMINPCLSVIPD